MNSVEQIEESYLRSNRTVETILLTDLSNSSRQKIVYVYNYEGYHYRVFDNVIELTKFLNNNEFRILKEYLKDYWVYNFLEKYQFNT
ncbi:MAG: hypothetical protein A2X54_06340 [Nitrospirae bacterium GWF2_44_13]|nr:MAG: hypothetical protein A2X54_06340 [Nitrospirae bacterium GWF2_44_13]OGW31854.1 MAG: hypothetical protein A2088_02010 [Nitrospirae bacterium GWD2_44_7]OGW64943.1 MAG: hypothetical protein A2222_04845 [Nitrospirae bacterium RIFOXYA2_FULL_44_9]OGW73366.1 MAG: hypothetical protein A2484_09095 [Nitrospirae bacterium RIFOXYC2_FULL_44_7]HBG92832.1 hypothetical protein [Nitrospiraceae bacterium]